MELESTEAEDAEGGLGTLRSKLDAEVVAAASPDIDRIVCPVERYWNCQKNTGIHPEKDGKR